MGLRTRVTALFAGGALVLTASLAAATYEVVRHNLLAERERSAVRAAYFDAAVVRPGVTSDDADVVAVLRALDTGQARRPLLRKDSTWYARSADDNLTRAVPVELINTVDGGHAAVQRVRVAGKPALVVGLPLPGTGAAFYEVQSLDEVQSTLRTLATALALVALTGTVAAALLSLAMARRALRPLREVRSAAQRVRAGHLDTTMASLDDPDLGALSTSFNEMVTEVRSRVEREQRFAADVSHELRSPLQSLSAACQVLVNRRDSFDPKAAAALDLMSGELGRFSSLVQSLLELARTENPLCLEQTDVHSLLVEVAQRFGVPRHSVGTAADAGLWVLDRPRMERVMENLLDNARKYGGGAVAVQAVLDAGGLRIDVDDAGPGVPAEERELILHRFARGAAAHSRGGSEGTGLGLALVADHVAAMGGVLEVLDRPRGGARFRIRLPKVPR